MSTSTVDVAPTSVSLGGPPRKGRILFIVPPFQTTFTPAIGVSQLKANLAQESFDSEILYLNFHYAERIGIREYESIVSRASTLFGDYVFSRALFGYDERDLERYVQEPFV